MALVGYFIVFSFVTKPGQTLEFLLWGTIVPLNFLAGYYCSIVASTPQPTVYAFTPTHTLYLYIRVYTYTGTRRNTHASVFSVSDTNSAEISCFDISIDWTDIAVLAKDNYFDICVIKSTNIYIGTAE